MASDNRIYLNWAAAGSPETFDYRVYQIDSKTKKAVELKKLDGKATSYLATNLKANTSYTYYAASSCVEGGKVVIGGNSNTISIQTKNVTDGYFYDQIFLARNWCSVHYTAKKATNAAMNAWTIQGVKAAVKYNYAANTNTLYIHLYYRVTGGGAKRKFEYYKPVFDAKTKALKFKKTKTSGSTYLALAKSGMKKHWTKAKIKGNSYDFKAGVVFKTKVILHQKSGKGAPGQRYIKLQLGVTGDAAKTGGMYWYFADNLHPAVAPYETINKIRYYSEQYDYLSQNFILNLVTQKQTANNPDSNYKSVEENPSAYSNVAAHELGHVLGLNDAYITDDKIVRSIDSAEVNNSIMQGDRTFTVTPNDFEMILNAQGTAAKYLMGSGAENSEALAKIPSWQNYKTYQIKYIAKNSILYYRYIISPVIKTRDKSKG